MINHEDQAYVYICYHDGFLINELFPTKLSNLCLKLESSRSC